ncbi:olfactory receptor [Striga asiatica]|uniref:Olfactory receptor n=1 Tax=Striga asiatica TaxID=4170 RepID=A0A5A7Q1B6_STRAF|nr:olfactory receptor [Striga asiatica]
MPQVFALDASKSGVALLLYTLMPEFNPKEEEDIGTSEKISSIRTSTLQSLKRRAELALSYVFALSYQTEHITNNSRKEGTTSSSHHCESILFSLCISISSRDSIRFNVSECLVQFLSLMNVCLSPLILELWENDRGKNFHEIVNTAAYLEFLTKEQLLLLEGQLMALAVTLPASCLGKDGTSGMPLSGREAKYTPPE